MASSSLSAKKALDKLIDTSQVIERRMGVREVEGKRVQEAFRLLTRGRVTAAKGGKQQAAYLEFLTRTRELVGYHGVALCAVGLGQSAIANMKDRARVDLPHDLKAREDITQNEHLRKITTFYRGAIPSEPARPTVSADIMDTDYTSNPPDTSLNTEYQNNTSGPDFFNSQDIQLTRLDYLTGDVYELNIEDVATVVDSNEISGKIFLTDTYKVDATSFVTIPISEELTNRLIRQRPRFM